MKTQSREGKSSQSKIPKKRKNKNHNTIFPFELPELHIEAPAASHTAPPQAPRRTTTSRSKPPSPEIPPKLPLQPASILKLELPEHSSERSRFCSTPHPATVYTKSPFLHHRYPGYRCESERPGQPIECLKSPSTCLPKPSNHHSTSELAASTSTCTIRTPSTSSWRPFALISLISFGLKIPHRHSQKLRLTAEVMGG